MLQGPLRLDLLDPRKVPLRFQVLAFFGIVEIAMTGLCQWSGRNESPVEGCIECLPGVFTGPGGISGESTTGVMCCTIVFARKSE
jgi:hypothetical protein